MKVAALLLVLYAASANSAEVQVQVVRLGAEVSTTETGLVTRTLDLLKSCTIESTSYAAHPSSWEEALKSESLVYLKFAIPQDVVLVGQPYKIDEVLVPLPKKQWPSHMFVRSGKGILSFTFYDPRSFRDLVWGAPFDYQNTPPYDSFANLPNY